MTVAHVTNMWAMHSYRMPISVEDRLQVSQVIGTEPILGVAGLSWLELRVLDSGESGLVDDEESFPWAISRFGFQEQTVSCSQIC
jgi:hypothetical protein